MAERRFNPANKPLINPAAAGYAVSAASGALDAADRVMQIAGDLRDGTTGSDNKTNPMELFKMSAKFAADLLIQSSLSTAPPIPAPYFPPLLYCTEATAVFGKEAMTNNVVAFSFADIGNLYVEDNSQPRAIPIQQVPDSNQDNVQDMGISSGHIKLSGRVFGQAGLSKFNMLRDLCKYKGKEGLIFLDKNIGKFRVYPGNIPGYTSSAEMSNQYAFQLTLIIVSEANKKSFLHNLAGQGAMYALAVCNVEGALRATIFQDLRLFKELDNLTHPEKMDRVRNIVSKYEPNVNDSKITEIIRVLDYGISRQPISTSNTVDYLEFNAATPLETLLLRNIVPSKVMDNGFSDGITKDYWLPTRAVGEIFNVYGKQVYNQLVEDEIPTSQRGQIDGDKGRKIDGAQWKKLAINSDYTVVDSILRDGYVGNWTKISFVTAPKKWGIVKADFRIPKTAAIELYDGERVLFGEGLQYIDKIEGSIRESLIGNNVVPFPISGSNLNVVSENDITVLYVPELMGDPVVLKNAKVKKRSGSISNGTMEDISGFTIIPSTTWGNKHGKWGKIVLEQSLSLGDFVSVDVVFKQDVVFFSSKHPNYTIKDSGNIITFKWLSHPRINSVGSVVNYLVLSPNNPNSNGGLYNTTFLTDDVSKVYWVKNGIDEVSPIDIYISDGMGRLSVITSDKYTIVGMTTRPAFNGIWGKITFNSSLIKDKIVCINCRLKESLMVFLNYFQNPDIYNGENKISLSWQEPIEDQYAANQYREIYPLPSIGKTGRNGTIEQGGEKEFWIPKIVKISDNYISELYPLKVRVNRVPSVGYTVVQEAEKTVGSAIEVMTKIVFDEDVSQGAILSVDFISQSESKIYEQHYLEEVLPSIYTDECKPMKNSLHTYTYYTQFAIDVNKPIEVRIGGTLIPKSQYIVKKVATRTHENSDGALITQLNGQIQFTFYPGDETDINVRYNRADTPSEETVKFSVYYVSSMESFAPIKDYYSKNILQPEKIRITDKNGSFLSVVKRVYHFPYPNGTEFCTYATNDTSAEFVFRPYDGNGDTYTTTIVKYSFEKVEINYLRQNIEKFDDINRPSSVDFAVPKAGEKDWIGRYNALVAIFSDSTPYQEKELASMLLGKLVGNADFSSDTQITIADVRNAKLWLQVYKSYVDMEDYVAAQKMLDERTKLLQLGVDGKPKESDAVNIVTIPSENPMPVDLPPINGWIVKETMATMYYKKGFVDIILKDFYGVPIANLSTNYNTAIASGILVSITKNLYGQTLYFDKAFKLRIRIICGSDTEEFQFNTVGDLINAVKNGQDVNASGGSVHFGKSKLISTPKVLDLKDNLSPALFNGTRFMPESFDLDHKMYNVFLMAIYADIDAISKRVQYPLNKYLKFQEIIGRKEASLTLEQGLDLYKFEKIKSVKQGG